MVRDDSTAAAATSAAVAATQQSRNDAAIGAAVLAGRRPAARPTSFALGDGLYRAPVAPYSRQPEDPLYRPLKIYSVDPSIPKLDGAIVTINVPYEPLEAGPVGCLFEVDTRDGELGIEYRRADLEDLRVLVAGGYQPSPTDPRFHQQMVYAVCSNVYSSFRMALGRNLSWGFGRPGVAAKLTLRPHSGSRRNACYEKTATGGSLCFGYYPADQRSTDGSMPGGYVFTCLSQDIVAHEVSHALLDGLRAQFFVPTGPDVPAFHEAFADLVAIFQHFSYREVLLNAIARCRGDVAKADVLMNLARQFGHTTGHGGPLRTAIEADSSAPRKYSAELEPHELGSVLVSAVFHAFVTIFQRKIERYIRLATQGTGVLPAGALDHDLQNVLADKASGLASQFLNICIRAIDYCPPVGITFGDYLRALITADYDLVPDDPWDYRGALIDAFRRRNIHPRSATSLSEDALRWKGPRIALPAVPKLDFGELRFKGDPAHAVGLEELQRQANALGQFATIPEHLEEFGLLADGDSRLGGDHVDDPRIESIRAARRAGPDGQIVFDLVAEITQLRHVDASSPGPRFSYHGGSTVILGPDGKIRYLVLKSVAGSGRAERRTAFLESMAGAKYWGVGDGGYQQRASMLNVAHHHGQTQMESATGSGQARSSWSGRHLCPAVGWPACPNGLLPIGT